MLNSLFKHWSYRIFAPGTLLRQKYEAFRELLKADSVCHEHMADFQALQYEGRLADHAGIRERFTTFSAHVLDMVDALNRMTPGKYELLRQYHKKFDFYTRFLLAPPKIDTAPPYTIPLEKLNADTPFIGKKAQNLAILHNTLGIPVPDGFAVSASAFHHFIEYNNLRGTIDALLSRLDGASEESFEAISAELQQCIATATIPPVIENSLLDHFDRLAKTSECSLRVAVRSNALGEDADFSFAGQYASILDVGRSELCRALQKVYASKYSRESLFYRISRGLGDEETAMSVLVVKMLTGKYSGILYTRGVLAETASEERMHLHVTEGLGDELAGGTITPDHFILSRGNPPEVIDGNRQLSNLEESLACRLGQFGLAIDNYFGTPQDIEWTLDENGNIAILQTRPLKISKAVASAPGNADDAQDRNRELLSGCQRASSGVAAGKVYILKSVQQLQEIPKGVVLITRDTPAELARVADKVSAVLAEKGSRASHFATVARECNIPMLVGLEGAAQQFESGSIVTVDGSRGKVYRGTMERLIEDNQQSASTQRGALGSINEALSFITPLELVDPHAGNFKPEGCRSMHDIIRFCHEKALQAMFTEAKPGTGRGAYRLAGDIPLDVYLFDIGGGIKKATLKNGKVPLPGVTSPPFQALWRGLSHPDVQWKQKPFDWDAFGKIELSGGVAPSRESFAFASYAVVGRDYLHFNIRFGYHFTIIDTLCGNSALDNHSMIRFAGGGGDYDQRTLRVEFLGRVLSSLGYEINKRGDLLEARLFKIDCNDLQVKLDLVGRLLGATKLMDMVLHNEQMVEQCVDDFFRGRYSFSQEG